MYVRSQLRLLPWQAHANVDASLPWEVSMRCGFAGVVTQAWTQEGSGTHRRCHHLSASKLAPFYRATPSQHADHQESAPPKLTQAK